MMDVSIRLSWGCWKMLGLAASIQPTFTTFGVELISNIHVTSNNIFCWSWQIHHYQNIFTFLQSGNPLILIIFPDFFSASFQFKSWTFLYFSTPRVSSTRAITYSLDNSKIFLNYLLIPLIFVLHTQIH